MDANTIEILNTVTHTINMPKLSESNKEVKINKWGKNIGDYIKRGDLIAVLETEEFTVDFESYSSGVLLYKGADNEGVLKIGEVLAVIGIY